MNLDDLDIEIEDDDGTGLRNGTIRYKGSIIVFAVLDNTSVEFSGKYYPWVADNSDAIVEEILKLL